MISAPSPGVEGETDPIGASMVPTLPGGRPNWTAAQVPQRAAWWFPCPRPCATSGPHTIKQCPNTRSTYHADSDNVAIVRPGPTATLPWRTAAAHGAPNFRRTRRRLASSAAFGVFCLRRCLPTWLSDLVAHPPAARCEPTTRRECFARVADQVLTRLPERPSQGGTSNREDRCGEGQGRWDETNQTIQNVQD